MKIREAKAGDADQISYLLSELGYEFSGKQVKQKIMAFEQSETDKVYVAIKGKDL
ncbi:MAG: hypothetical protein JRJ39_07010, partial [Deltaproteobacteria bacterium]|nr:hypothetical protein [Deltaproteobacteria bacterium]